MLSGTAEEHTGPGSTGHSNTRGLIYFFRTFTFIFGGRDLSVIQWFDLFSTGNISYPLVG